MMASQLMVYSPRFPSQHPKEDDPNWVCGSVGELCEIGYEELVSKFGRGCASGGT
jgi:hypothetical protein